MCLSWPGKDDVQLGRYIADRTGIICFYNLPLMFLFAGRNDIFIWLTGWTYSTSTEITLCWKTSRVDEYQRR